MGEGNRWKRPGDAYWAWSTAPFALMALVWADGQSEASQDTEWDGREHSGGNYWPCIIAVVRDGSVVPDDLGRLPFYCPGLAEGQARPWWVHFSRLRMVPGRWRDELIFEGEEGIRYPYLPMSRL